MNTFLADAATAESIPAMSQGEARGIQRELSPCPVNGEGFDIGRGCMVRGENPRHASERMKHSPLSQQSETAFQPTVTSRKLAGDNHVSQRFARPDGLGVTAIL